MGFRVSIGKKVGHEAWMTYRYAYLPTEQTQMCKINWMKNLRRAQRNERTHKYRQSVSVSLREEEKSEQRFSQRHEEKDYFVPFITRCAW